MKPGSLGFRYLTASDEEANWGLIITTVGYQSVPPHTGYPPKGHPSSYWFNPSVGRKLDEYQLIYVTKGEGYFASETGLQHTIKAGSLFLLFPSEWHTYKPLREKGWDTYWIGFNGGIMNNLVGNNYFNKKRPVYEIGSNEQVIELFKQSLELANLQEPGYQQVISGIVLHILGITHYTVKNNFFVNDEVIQKINMARLIIREHPEKDITAEQIASSINMGYSWFRRMFKKYTGLSPTQYQLQIKLQKSKEFLTSSNMPIKQIASILNFSSQNYFIAFFKEKTGLSPAEFRKKIHNP